MSDEFRDLLRKVGSGTHTAENLTRQEAAIATKMMLLGEATPAQIGAFLIAHRIKRPTGEELAGMLDAYEDLGPKLRPISSSRPVVVLGIPYDGRIRTAPISPVTALILAASGQPVIMHGGGCLPTKYGFPLIEIWQGLGVNWTNLNLERVQEIFAATGIGFVYTPVHFPLTQRIWEYRDQLGKRPPLATMELIWCPYGGDAHIIAGFVHPPTENMFRKAIACRNVKMFTTIKGLEGSCDLPRERTAIIGLGIEGETDENGEVAIKRLHLAARDYNFTNQNVALGSKEELITGIQNVLKGNSSELMETALWNGGFYLWRTGISTDVENGIKKSKELLISGAVANKLEELINSI